MRNQRKIRKPGAGIRSVSRSSISNPSPRRVSRSPPRRSIAMIPRFHFGAALRISWVAAAALQAALFSPPPLAETVPARGIIDSRIRAAPYDSEQVYKVRGFVGYQIDFEF